MLNYKNPDSNSALTPMSGVFCDKVQLMTKKITMRDTVQNKNLFKHQKTDFL